MEDGTNIKLFYNDNINIHQYKIKENVEDFIVQEVADYKCSYNTILDLEKFYDGKDAISKLPLECSKEERKTIYTRTNHFPIKKVFAKEGILDSCDDTFDTYVCTLMKYNLTTVDACSIISKALGISSKSINFAGNKDKRGITYQEISIKCDYQKLISYAYSLSQNTSFHDQKFGFEPKFHEENQKIYEVLSEHLNLSSFENKDNLMLFSIRKGHNKLLGDLKGNSFKIRVHQKLPIPSNIKYFYNYFGPQRFGTNFNNHIIGECILNKKYDEAIQLILEGKTIDDLNTSIDATNNSNMKIEGFSRTQRYILNSMKKKQNSKNIIEKIDRPIKMLYLHSYQSYIFNNNINTHIESKSVKEGDKVILNDELVAAKENTKFIDLILPLEGMNNKMLKGGNRKMVEEIQEFNVIVEEDSIVLEFYLNKSCYATVALREILGTHPIELKS